jgi:hypothetical protein
MFPMKARIISILLVVVGCCASSKPAPSLPVGRSLPDVLVSILADVKAGTSISVLLPTELPKPFSDAEHATVLKASEDEYAVALYYEMGMGDAGFAASFSAKKKRWLLPSGIAECSRSEAS